MAAVPVNLNFVYILHLACWAHQQTLFCSISLHISKQFKANKWQQMWNKIVCCAISSLVGLENITFYLTPYPNILESFTCIHYPFLHFMFWFILFNYVTCMCITQNICVEQKPLQADISWSRTLWPYTLHLTSVFYVPDGQQTFSTWTSSSYMEPHG